MKPERLNQVALMFSGGVDSTVCALELAKTFDRVHLLTYETGFGHYNMNKSEKRFRELERLVGPRFSFNRIDIRKQFKTFVVDRLLDDYRCFGSGFIMCMGCKVLMHARTARYALDAGMSSCAEGASGATGEMVEQMLVSISLLRLFYQEHGLEYLLPVYDRVREDSIAMLNAKGFNMGLRILDRHLGIQPRCIRGELYYLPYLLFKQPPDHSEAVIARFISQRLKEAQVLNWEV